MLQNRYVYIILELGDMAIWPSGLRRQNQAFVVHLVRKGEGSNPSVVNVVFPFI